MKNSARISVPWSITRLIAGSAMLLCLASGVNHAQELAVVTLPDAPGFLMAASSSSSIADTTDLPSLIAAVSEEPGEQTRVVSPSGATASPRSPLDKIILPGEIAPKLTVYDKSLLGVKHVISPFSAMGWVLSASYSQAVDGAPNYGQTGKGYLQRLGASAARSGSEGIFSDSVLSSALKEDPRYYKLGRGSNPAKRFLYAATRTVFTKTDGGSQTINFSLLGGNLAGAALTQAYYPPVNRGFGEVVKTFGTSILGSAVGFEFSEFITNAAEIIHLRSH